MPWLCRVADRARILAADGIGPGAEGVLSGQGEVTATTSRADAARNRVAVIMPALAGGLQRGTLGGEHLDAVARALHNASDVQVAALQAEDAALAQAAAHLPVDAFARTVRRAMQAIGDGVGTASPDSAGMAEFHHWMGRDRVGRFSGRLPAEAYERMATALEAAMRELAHQANASAETADGLVPPVAMDAALAAEAFLSRMTGPSGTGQARPSITVVVDAVTALHGPRAGGLCETGDGTPLAPETFRRCACDATFRTLVTGTDGRPLRTGRRHRTATDAQWSALRALYTSCAWYGCDRPLRWCQAHHVVYWERFGPTDIENLVPLCHRHHHVVHEGGWRLELTADRELHHLQPDGNRWRSSRPDRLASPVRRRRRDQAVATAPRAHRNGRSRP